MIFIYINIDNEECEENELSLFKKRKDGECVWRREMIVLIGKKKGNQRWKNG